MKTVSIQCEEVDLRYGKVSAIQGLSWSAAEGEFHVLLGESGCGKTSLLRAIAGFERLQAGRILLGGRIVEDAASARRLPPEERRVGMVFQDYALFPHLTVFENVRFGAGSADRAREILRAVGLDAVATRRPDSLSGGQQQRVAVARALASEPQLLLFDEPFSNLDPSLRSSLRQLTRAIVREHGLTAVLVTHDAADAFTLADRISVMHRGRILQTGTPSELYLSPTSDQVARSLGVAQYVAATREDGVARCVFGSLRVRADADGDAILIRPEQIRLESGGAEAICLSCDFMGPVVRAWFRLDDGTLLAADLDPAEAPAPSERVGLAVRSPVVWVPDATPSPKD